MTLIKEKKKTGILMILTLVAMGVIVVGGLIVSYNDIHNTGEDNKYNGYKVKDSQFVDNSETIELEVDFKK